MFHYKNKIRKCCVWIAEWNVFKMLILLAVIANAIIMGMHSYRHRIDEKVKQVTELDYVSARIFVCIFSLELIIKVIAMGFVLQKNSYLRNGWNVLDFVSLLTGVTEVIELDVADLMWLRTLRVIKPLRSVKAFP